MLATSSLPLRNEIEKHADLLSSLTFELEGKRKEERKKERSNYCYRQSCIVGRMCRVYSNNKHRCNGGDEDGNKEGKERKKE